MYGVKLTDGKWMDDKCQTQTTDVYPFHSVKDADERANSSLAEDTPYEVVQEPTLEQKLEALLWKRFGNNWRETIRIDIRADALSWMFKLACWGFESRREKMRGPNGKIADISDIMSLGSWKGDLEALLKSIETAPIVKPKKGAK